MIDKKLTEIAGMLKGTLKGSGELFIKNIAPLEEAASEDISLFYDAKRKHEIDSTKAGALIIPEGLLSSFDLGARFKGDWIAVKDPREALATLLDLFYYGKYYPVNSQGEIHPSAVVAKTARIANKVTIGPLAVVDSDAVIGEGSVIRAHAYIGAGARIGSGTIIAEHVTVGERCIIGNNVIIHAGCVIGSDGFGFITSAHGHRKIPQVGIVEIEDRVEMGGNVVIDRATLGRTLIGAGTKIDNLVHIAHNVKIGKNCIILGLVGIAGSAHLGNGVMIAGQAGVIDHAVVGDGVIITGQTGVTGNVKAGEIVSGFPARPHREFLKEQASLKRLPELMQHLNKKKG